jgi:PII-like signaling protein
MFYRDNFDWIESLDTSNPVVHGLLGKWYSGIGLLDKQSIKLVDLLHTVPNVVQWVDIRDNIEAFRKIVR